MKGRIPANWRCSTRMILKWSAVQPFLFSFKARLQWANCQFRLNVCVGVLVQNNEEFLLLVGENTRSSRFLRAAHLQRCKHGNAKVGGKEKASVEDAPTNHRFITSGGFSGMAAAFSSWAALVHKPPSLRRGTDPNSRTSSIVSPRLVLR